MTEKLDRRLEKGHRVALAAIERAPAATAVPVLILNLVLFAGWVSGVLRTGLTTRVKCNATLGLSLAALSLLLLRRDAGARVTWARILGGLCAAIGILTLIEYATGINLGIDELLSPDPAFALQSAIAAPGRVAPNTALCLALFGTGLCLLNRKGVAGAAAQVLVGAAGFIAGIAALGYLYGVSALYHVVAYLRLGQVPSASVLLLSVGALSLSSQRRPMALLTTAGPGGSIARRLLVFVILVPPLAGLAALSLLRRDAFDPATAISLLVVALILLFAGAALGAARLVQRVDAERAVALRHRAQIESERNRLYEAGVVAIANLEPDGRVRVANDRFLALTGYTREEMEAGALDAERLAVADFAEADRRGVQEIRATGLCRPYRSALRRKDGVIVPLLVGAAALDPGNRQVAFFVDLREQQELEAKLVAAIEESRRLAQVVEESPDFIGIADLAGGVLYVNRAGRALVGLGESDVRSGKVADYFFPEDAPASAAAMGAVLTQGHAELEVRLRHFRTQEAVPVAWHIFALRDENGVPSAIATITRDQRERRRIEEERERLVADLQRALRVSDLFVGILGHDLRNPLNAILGAALVAKNARSLERAQQSADRIVASTQRMARMVTDLLDFTRIRAGRGLELRFRRMDLRAVCVDVIEELRQAQPSRLIECEFHGDVVGQWDGDRLAQVISNLVGNALQHGAPTAPVRVAVDGTLPSSVALQVRNQGDPIPDEVKERLFQPFFGDARVRGGASSGLGLGLYISREIVRHHGGELRAVSTGSEIVFRLELPRLGGESRPRDPGGEVARA